jgi:hypothetical protein
VNVEGALSRHDLNTYSSLDDGDNAGGAGKARVTLAGGMPGFLGSGGLELQARGVGRRFDPFSRLERPFAQEDWGLPVSADIEHQTRYDLNGFIKPRLGGELRTSVGQLTTPDGFQSLRGTAQWLRDGRLGHAPLVGAGGWSSGRTSVPGGGRERSTGELVWHTAWIEPLVRGEWDERRSPSDTGLVGARRATSAPSFGARARAAGRAGRPRRARRGAARGYRLRGSESGTHAAGVTGDAAPVAVGSQPRLASPERRAAQRSPSHAKRPGERACARGGSGHGWSGTANMEVTSEGENTRVRRLVYVGPGNGPYDALGNPVGGGDYDLAIDVSNELARVSRVATSARGMWQFGASDAWRGSRIEADFETEARRRGDVRFADAWISPGAALTSADLARGAVTQRLESDLAPGSAFAAFRLRVERRVSGDRSYLNFTQSLDQRSASARWRARPGPSLSQDIEVRWKRDEAGQSLLAGAQYTAC